MAKVKQILFYVALSAVFVVYQVNKEASNDLAVLEGKAPYRLIMYSLTTCGFCKQKVEQLKRENIAFKEYFIDTDEYRFQEVTDKLAAAGYAPQGYGTPIFDANGTMLPNNPSMKLLRSTLRASLAPSAAP